MGTSDKRHPDLGHLVKGYHCIHTPKSPHRQHPDSQWRALIYSPSHACASSLADRSQVCLAFTLLLPTRHSCCWDPGVGPAGRRGVRIGAHAKFELDRSTGVFEAGARADTPPTHMHVCFRAPGGTKCREGSAPLVPPRASPSTALIQEQELARVTSSLFR